MFDSPTASITLPARASARWLVFAEGCLPAEGVWQGSGAKDDVLDVELERGHGLIVMAFDPWYCGVDQAEIAVDGAPAGRTNDLGYAALELRGEPRAVKVGKPGWLTLFSMVDLEEGMGVVVLAPEG
jgi:hypothetical protein